jgi:hypothetical protein
MFAIEWLKRLTRTTANADAEFRREADAEEKKTAKRTKQLEKKRADYDKRKARRLEIERCKIEANYLEQELHIRTREEHSQAEIAEFVRISREEADAKIRLLTEQENARILLEAQERADLEIGEDEHELEVERARTEQEQQAKLNVIRDELRRKKSFVRRSRIAVAVPYDVDELIEAEHECVVCMSDIPLIEGYRCTGTNDGAHFICNDCLTAYIQAAVNCNIGDLEAMDGKIRCFGENGCNAQALSVETIMRHAPDAWNDYYAAQQALTEKRLSERIRMEERERLEAEQARLALLNIGEREVLKHHTHIVENLLTLCCPQCKAAFLDFDGCFALRCGSCECNFCALCLEGAATSRAAHIHVNECNAGSYYGSKEQFAQAQKVRREKLVRAYLTSIAEDEMRGRVVQRARQDLQDLELGAIILDFPMFEVDNAAVEAEAAAAAATAAAAAAVEKARLDAIAAAAVVAAAAEQQQREAAAAAAAVAAIDAAIEEQERLDAEAMVLQHIAAEEARKREEQQIAAAIAATASAARLEAEVQAATIAAAAEGAARLKAEVEAAADVAAAAEAARAGGTAINEMTRLEVEAAKTAAAAAVAQKAWQEMKTAKAARVQAEKVTAAGSKEQTLGDAHNPFAAPPGEPRIEIKGYVHAAAI